MKILITGGGGFIARNLHEHLQDEHAVVACHRADLDLLDASAVANYLVRQQFDVVIHAATYDAAPKHSTKDPSKVLENNLRMFFNITRCASDFGRMIYFGSGAEFSREHWISRMTEEYFDQHVPTDQYGYSKYLMTHYSAGWSNILNLRLFGVFGKYDDWRVRFISNGCCFTVLDLPIKIHQNRMFDFLNIDDLASIVKRFLKHPPSKSVLNICSGRAIDFRTVAEMIIRVAGKSLPVEILTDGWGREYSGDNSRLREELPDFQFSSLEESIKTLYEWYATNSHLIDRHLL